MIDLQAAKREIVIRRMAGQIDSEQANELLDIINEALDMEKKLHELT